MADNDKSVCPPGLEAGLIESIRICRGEGEAMAQAGRLIGLRGEEPDVDCSAALREGLNEETLRSLDGTRQWVMCRVFNAPPGGGEALIDKHDDNLALALEDAWDEVDAAREDMGIDG